MHLAIVDYNRANILTLLDRTREARQLYDSAREVFVKRKLPALIAQADFSLASIDLAEGRLDPCLMRLTQAKERLAALGDQLRVAHTELDAADAFLRLNRPADAAEQAQRAEEFFRRLAQKLGHAMLLRKGELHQLMRLVDPASISPEVSEKLDLLKKLFEQASPGEEESRMTLQ